MRYEKKRQEDWLKINIKRQGERTVKCGKKKWIGGHWGMRASIGAKSLLAGADDCIRCEEAMLRRGTSNFLIGICAFSVLVQVGNTKSRYMLNNPTCNAKYLKRTDMAVAKLLGFGPHGRLFPENHQQLKGYCQ